MNNPAALGRTAGPRFEPLYPQVDVWGSASWPWVATRPWPEAETFAPIRPVQTAADVQALLRLDPFTTQLSSRDVLTLAVSGDFPRYVHDHDLGDVWPSATASSPQAAHDFYRSLVSTERTAMGVWFAEDVDFRRIPPDRLTQDELDALQTTGRFGAYLDAFGLQDRFVHGQTYALVVPTSVEAFHAQRRRDRTVQAEAVVARVRETVLRYLRPTVRFYHGYLLAPASLGSRGASLPQALLDLFTVYLQTRSEVDLARALETYFGVAPTEAASRAHAVASAFFGFMDRALALGAEAQAAGNPPTHPWRQLRAYLNALPGGAPGSTGARPFEDLDPGWGAVARTLLDDFGLLHRFMVGAVVQEPCRGCHGEEALQVGITDLGLMEALEMRAEGAAELLNRVSSIQTLEDVYGFIHLFQHSAVDRAWIYEHLVGVPEWVVQMASDPPARQPPPVCSPVHVDPFDQRHPRPEGRDITRPEWAVALELARAQRAQQSWDTAVSVLQVGGSIGAALLAGALTGGLGWAAAATAAMATAGATQVVQSAYDIEQARFTALIASGAHATADLHPEFGLGSEAYAQWALHNYRATEMAARGSTLVAIATAPIGGGATGTVLRKVAVAMAMGGLDGLGSWMVDPRLNDQDFLIETHALQGGRGPATTTGQTLLMSIGMGALVGGLFESGLIGAQGLLRHVRWEAGPDGTRVWMQGASGPVEVTHQRLRVHTDANGRTRYQLDDGTELEAPLRELDAQMRRPHREGPQHSRPIDEEGVEWLPPHLRGEVRMEIDADLSGDTVIVWPEFDAWGLQTHVVIRRAPGSHLLVLDDHIVIADHMVQYNGVAGAVRRQIRRWGAPAHGAWRATAPLGGLVRLARNAETPAGHSHAARSAWRPGRG